jgi:hypothetical protein
MTTNKIDNMQSQGTRIDQILGAAAQGSDEVAGPEGDDS